MTADAFVHLPGLRSRVTHPEKSLLRLTPQMFAMWEQRARAAERQDRVAAAGCRDRDLDAPAAQDQDTVGGVAAREQHLRAVGQNPSADRLQALPVRVAQQFQELGRSRHRAAG